MRIPLVVVAAAILAPRVLVAAPASEKIVTGTVVDSRSAWTASGRRILTESLVRGADGREVAVRQLGGSIDGIGMLVIPSPPLLRRGDEVFLRVGAAASGAGAAWVREVERYGIGAQSATPDRLAFVRTTNESGADLYWPSSCVFITYDQAGTSHIPGALEFGIMDRVFATWQTETRSCSYLHFELEGSASVEVGLDGINVVKIREDSWCPPDARNNPAACYDEKAAGLTTLFFYDDSKSRQNGAILDADIELNAIHFAISDNDASLGTGCKSDLANTLTHEVGHLMGLDHTCWNGKGTRPVDERNIAVPRCEGPLPMEVTEATMYNFQDCGETKKASPEANDIAGVCSIYPTAKDPNQCSRSDIGGKDYGCCAATPAASGNGLPVALALGVLLLGNARRRRSRAANKG